MFADVMGYFKPMKEFIHTKKLNVMKYRQCLAITWSLLGNYTKHCFLKYQC